MYHDSTPLDVVYVTVADANAFLAFCSYGVVRLVTFSVDRVREHVLIRPCYNLTLDLTMKWYISSYGNGLASGYKLRAETVMP